MESVNETHLNMLFDNAEKYKRLAEVDILQGNETRALVYATLYQAENIRIANFLTELQLPNR